MKTISFLPLVLAICLLPAMAGAQSTSGESDYNEPVNYYAEFADLMHGETNVRPSHVNASTAEKFPAFVHFREVMKGNVQEFLTAYEAMMHPSVPTADEVFANWTAFGKNPDPSNFLWAGEPGGRELVNDKTGRHGFNVLKSGYPSH